MKKVLIIAVLTVFLLLTCKPVRAQASASTPPSFPNCSKKTLPLCAGGWTSCGSSGYCCQSAADCTGTPQAPGPEAVSVPVMADICKSTGPQMDKCVSCVTDGSHMWTAFGCLDANPSTVVSSLITFAIGMAGGLAFLLILFGGFSMMTSAGNPERLNSGRELVTAALSGLVLVIFSVFILRLIGVNILGIPGFS